VCKKQLWKENKKEQKTENRKIRKETIRLEDIQHLWVSFVGLHDQVTVLFTAMIAFDIEG
jgi:hypothetical protein